MLFIFALPVMQVILFCLAIGREPSGLRIAIANGEMNDTIVSGPTLFEQETNWWAVDFIGNVYVNYAHGFLKLMNFTYPSIALPIRIWLHNKKLVVSLSESFKFNDNQRILSESGGGSRSGTGRSCMGCSIFHGQLYRCVTGSNAAWYVVF